MVEVVVEAPEAMALGVSGQVCRNGGRGADEVWKVEV